MKLSLFVVKIAVSIFMYFFKDAEVPSVRATFLSNFCTFIKTFKYFIMTAIFFPIKLSNHLTCVLIKFSKMPIGLSNLNFNCQHIIEYRSKIDRK